MAKFIGSAFTLACFLPWVIVHVQICNRKTCYNLSEYAMQKLYLLYHPIIMRNAIINVYSVSLIGSSLEIQSV